MGGRRVFVTGAGIVSPCGNNVREGFEKVFAAEPALQTVQVDRGAPEEAVIVARSDFDLADEVPRVRSRLMARVSQMAILATRDALGSAGIAAQAANQETGIYLGCAIGGSEELQRHFERFNGNQRIRPATTPIIMASGPASHISMHFRLLGPAITYSVACVSSAIAIGEAFRTIRDGYLDQAIAGGTDAQLNPGALAAWSAMGALATKHADGVGASSRPFDAGRTGLVIGEGAACLLLESEDTLTARGGEPLAEIVGFGMSSDAHNLTEPLMDGQARAMGHALRDAGLEPAQIGYLNAHATGTRTGDVAECAAIKSVFSTHASSIPVSSTKGVHGHLIGAAGALEAVWTIRALETGRVPPTANLTDPDPACDLDCVPLVGRRVDGLEYALSNSFAFGGSNAALVFRKA